MAYLLDANVFIAAKNLQKKGQQEIVVRDEGEISTEDQHDPNSDDQQAARSRRPLACTEPKPVQSERAFETTLGSVGDGV